MLPIKIETQYDVGVSAGVISVIKYAAIVPIIMPITTLASQRVTFAAMVIAEAITKPKKKDQSNTG